VLLLKSLFGLTVVNMILAFIHIVLPTQWLRRTFIVLNIVPENRFSAQNSFLYDVELREITHF